MNTDREATFGFNSTRNSTCRAGCNQACLDWQVAQAPLRWMPKLDAIALECLRSDRWAHRWIRLSPRYLRTQRSRAARALLRSGVGNADRRKFDAAIRERRNRN